MSATPETIGDLLGHGIASLAAGLVDNPKLDARLLLAHQLGVPQETVIAWPERPAPPDARAGFEALLHRRAAGEPVSRLLGRREFWSLPFAVGPDTLDPRPDTETLVEAVLAARPDRSRPWRILDLGTGTGCILLALLTEYPAARGIGLDRVPGAVATATRNARDLGLADRSDMRLGDWTDGETIMALRTEPVDILVSNPPYIPRGGISSLAPEVARFDPPCALDGGPDGLDAFRTLAGLSTRLTRTGGLVGLECGRGQTDIVTTLLEMAELKSIYKSLDLAGIERCIIATV